MPDNWINERKLTSEDAIYDLDGNKIHDLIDTEVYGGEDLDAEKYPVLWGKLAFDGSHGVEGQTFDTGESGLVNGSFYFDNHLWVSLNDSDTVYKFNMNGVLQESITLINPDPVSFLGSQAVCVDDSHIYILTHGTYSDVMSKYQHDGSFVLQVTLSDHELLGLGLGTDGSSLYLPDDNKIRVYSKDLVYTSDIIIDYEWPRRCRGIIYLSDGILLADAYGGVEVFDESSGLSLFYYDTESVPRDVFSASDTWEEGISFIYGDGSTEKFGDTSKKYIPTITRPSGSPSPYKIVADATSE